MTTSSDNGFLVHWLNYQSNVYNLAFYNFAGELKKSKDITSLMTAGSYKGTMPIDYSFANGISIIDQNASQWLILDRLNFNLVSKRSLSAVISPSLPSSFTQNSPAFFDFNKVSDVSLYLPNPSYNSGIYITQSDYKSLTDVLYSPNLKQSSQSSTPLIFKDNNNNSYAVYYSVNVQSGGDTITFTVYKNNLPPKTFTFPINDNTTNGLGVQAGAMVGKYNVVENAIYLALGYKLGSGGSGSSATYPVGTAPYGIAIDSSGNVWVANYGSNNVTKLSPSGATLGTYAVGTQPKGIAIDSSGNAWVANYGSNNVTKLSPSGATLGTYAVGTNPESVVIDLSGNIWITNFSSSTVTKLSSNGVLIGTYTTTISYNGYSPVGLAIDNSGNVWIANNSTSASHYYVNVLNSSGNPVLSADVGYATPFDVKIDSLGNIWVSDPTYNNILKLNSGGSIIGNYSTGSNPESIAIDSSNNVWIVNKSSNNVMEFNSSGTVIGTYNVGTSPQGIAIDSSGNVWVANQGDNTVTKLSVAGNPYAELVNVWRYDLFNSLTQTFSYYNKTDPTNEPLYPVDISWDYNKKIHLAIADLNITANTGAFKIIRLDTSSSYTLVATVDTFTAVTDLNNQNFFSITDFYMDTRALALSQGDGLLVPNNIEFYKAVPVSQGKRGIRNE